MTIETLPDWLQPVNESTIVTYALLGWKLIPVPPGTKGPRKAGWNRAENCYLPDNWTGNVGLALAYSGVVSIDIDHWLKAARWLVDRGIDMDALYQAPGAVKIDSGKPGHGKLLYRLPEGSQPLVSQKIIIDRECILEFRCATSNGLTVQDLVYPSIHPETQQPYRWVKPDHIELFDWLNAMPTLPDDLLKVWQDLAAPREPVITNSDLSADWQQVKEALGCISPDCSRDEWIRVGMGLHDAGVKSGSPDTGFYLWDEWSQGSAKYPDDREMSKQWGSFKSGDGISLGTLFKLAKDAGWTRPAPDPQELFKDVVASHKTPSSETSHKSWGELSTRIFDPIDWVVSDLIPPGVSLLVGRPKQGKSWLVHAMALMVAAGRPVFGLQTSGAAVLYMALEDSERRLHDRTKKLIKSYGLSDAELHSKFYYMTHAPMLGDGLETALQAKMDEIPNLRLIVIDVLAQVRQGRRGSQSVYEADYEVGKQLKTVSAMFPDVAILVVHHANKGGGDALDSVSGTNGLSGGVDNIFTLMHGNAGMELHINGRDIEDSSTIPLIKGVDKMWTLASRQEAAEVMRSDTRTSIVNAMREGASSPKEIAEAAGLPDHTVKLQLGRMVKQDEVIKTGRGSYVLFET